MVYQTDASLVSSDNGPSTIRIMIRVTDTIAHRYHVTPVAGICLPERNCEK